VQCKYPALTQKVEEQVEDLKNQLLKARTQSPGPQKFSISFFQYVLQEKFLGMLPHKRETAKTPWEQWEFTVELLKDEIISPERQAERREELRTDLKLTLEGIIDKSLSNLDHLPSLIKDGDDPQIFPFRINSSNSAPSGWNIWNIF